MHDQPPITSFEETGSRLIASPAAPEGRYSGMLPRVLFAAALLIGSMVAVVMVRTS